MSDKEFPITQGGQLLRRGYTSDPECHRTTHRLRVASGILRGMGINRSLPEHSDHCMLSAKQRGNRCFGYSYHCECGVGHDPQPVWPEWATGKIFDLAYQLADESQTERGSYYQREISAARREKVAS